MKREKTTWHCRVKGCEVTTTQSASVTAAGHRCGKGKHYRPLYPVKKQ